MSLFEHVPPQYPENPYPRIAFVGEAPGAVETEKGIPLVGSAGRIFDAMLRTVGLDRKEFLVTNVFDQKLPDNNLAAWCLPLAEARQQGLTDLPPVGSAGFLKSEYRWHLERLRDEILAVNPSIIVPLGPTALWAFTGSACIASARGNIRTASHVVPGIKLLPTYDPKFVMQQWKYFSVVARDIERAYYEGASSRSVRLPERKLLVEPTLNEWRDYMPKLLSSDLLSVDIETGWGQITCIGFAPNANEAISVPFVDLRRPSRSYWPSLQEEYEAWMLVKQILESPVPKLGQNFGMYDAFWLIDRVGIEPRNFLHDTRLMHHAMYPELPKSLQFMAANYTAQGTWKTWGKKGVKRDD